MTEKDIISNRNTLNAKGRDNVKEMKINILQENYNKYSILRKEVLQDLNKLSHRNLNEIGKKNVQDMTENLVKDYDNILLQIEKEIDELIHA